MRTLDRIHLCLAAVAIALGSLNAAAVADAVDDMFLDALAQDAVDIARQRTEGLKARYSGPSFNELIDKARTAYWQAFVSGQGLDEAGKEFADLLSDKDLGLMVMSFADDAQAMVPGRRPGNQVLGDLAFFAIKSGIDGGVRPDAVDEFLRWKEVIQRRRDKAHPQINIFNAVSAAGEAMVESIQAADPEVVAYVEARNRAEKKAALHLLTFKDDPEYLKTLVALDFEPDHDAERWYAQREAVVGAEQMRQIAGDIRRAPKDKNGNLSEPAFVDAKNEALRLTVAERIDRRIGNSSPRLYVLWQIRRQLKVDWNEAAQIYQQYWVQPFGEEAVIAAAQKLLAAPKRVRANKEILVDPIAGDVSPEWALAKLMPQQPYRDRPLGSLDSTDPREYLLALFKQGAGIEHWVDVPLAFEKFKTEQGESPLLEAAGKIMGARKDAQGRLAAPQELGVTSADPWDALQELLNQNISEPDRYLAHLLKQAGWTWAIGIDQPAFQMHWALQQYKRLTDAYGKQKVDAVIAQVREAARKNVDLATLDGAVSKFKDPLPAIHDILLSTATPEQFMAYVDPGGWRIKFYTERYGRDMLEDVIARVQKTPRQWGPMKTFDKTYQEGFRIDPETFGFDPVAADDSVTDPRSIDARMKQLLTQQKEQKDATPFEVGQVLEFGGRQTIRVKIIRALETDRGMQYLVSYGDTAAWHEHKWALGGKRVEGDLHVDPAKAQKLKTHEANAVAHNHWPAGSHVVVRVDGKSRDGTVIFFEGRSTPPAWAVDYLKGDDATAEHGIGLFSGSLIREPRPASKTRQQPRSPEPSSPSAGAGSGETAPQAPAAAADAETLAIGSRVQWDLRSQVLQGTIQEFRGEGSRRRALVEFEIPGQSVRRRTWVNTSALKKLPDPE